MGIFFEINESFEGFLLLNVKVADFQNRWLAANLSHPHIHFECCLRERFWGGVCMRWVLQFAVYMCSPCTFDQRKTCAKMEPVLWSCHECSPVRFDAAILGRQAATNKCCASGGATLPESQPPHWGQGVAESIKVTMMRKAEHTDTKTSTRSSPQMNNMKQKDKLRLNYLGRRLGIIDHTGREDAPIKEQTRAKQRFLYLLQQ